MSHSKSKEKSFTLNLTDPFFKYHIADYNRTVPAKDFAEKVGRCSSYDQIQRQKQELLRKLSNFTANQATRPVPNISVTPSNQIAKKHNNRSKSSLRQSVNRPANSLNQSLNFLSNSDLNASLTKIPRPVKKKGSVPSLNRTFQESVTLPDLDASHTDLNLTRFPQINDLLDLETEKKGEMKKTNGLNSTTYSYGADSDTDKKVREIIHKYQLRDAIHRQEIAKLKQTNIFLQVQLNKSEIALTKSKKQNKKDEESIRELEIEVKQLKEKLRNRSKDARRGSIEGRKGSLKGGLRASTLGKDEEVSKVSELKQKVEDLTAEKRVLEDMLKNALLTIERAKFQSKDKKPAPLNESFHHENQKTLSVASNSKRSQPSTKPKIPLHPKDLNVSGILSPDYQSNQKFNPLDKSFYQSGTPVLSTLSSKSPSGSNNQMHVINKEVEKADTVQEEEGPLINAPSVNDLQSLVVSCDGDPDLQEDSSKSNLELTQEEQEEEDHDNDGDSVKEAVFQQPTQSSREDESELESCSGRISPQKMVLRNVKVNELVCEASQKANKFNTEKLKLDLSRIRIKNY